MTMTAVAEFKDRTVGEIAAEMPSSIRVFEMWKIDYCCGGLTPLPQACEAAGRTLEDFVADLVKATVPDASRDWKDDSLATMSSQICALYHDYTRQELITLAPIADKVLGVHGSRHPELAEVVMLIRDLTSDLIPHMLKEEQVLFPYVTEMERSAAGGGHAPTPFFGTVKNPVRMMMQEHDRVGDLLARLRAVTDEYVPPEGACFSYRELYRRLTEFEQRTHEHIHVENNIYFPRAVALEDRAGEPAAFGAGGCGLSGCSH